MSKSLENKLYELFKAIYQRDSNLEEKTKEAFECMKNQKISGNICPHIKKAIHDCIDEKRKEIEEFWMRELTTEGEDGHQLKPVHQNADSYGEIIRMLISAYQLYNDSVDTIVDVWKEMLNSSNDLRKTFFLLIMSEFVETIWKNNAIKIIVEEIQKSQKELSNYKEEVRTLLGVGIKLDKIHQDFNTSYPAKTESPSSACGDSHKTPQALQTEALRNGKSRRNPPQTQPQGGKGKNKKKNKNKNKDK